MKRRPTFAQVEMAKMRKRRLAEDLANRERIRERRELYAAKEQARTAESEAVKMATSELIANVVGHMSEKLADDAARILRDQFSKLEMTVRNDPCRSEGMAKIISMTLPELRWNYAVPVRDIELCRL